MSIGEQALILIRLDARHGEVVSVDDLSVYLRLPAERVRQRILELWHQGYAVPEQQGLADGSSLITGAMAAPKVPSCV